MEIEKNDGLRQYVKRIKKQRRTWAIDPETKIIKSKKAYKRDRDWQKHYEEENEEVDI